MEEQTVRPAVPGDTSEILSVAEAGWTETYDGILSEETVETALERDHTVCTVQSMPEVGIAVFGFWSLATPLALIGLGIGLLSPIGILAVAGCVMPFFLSLLSAWALYL